jgi:hypothetical protein
MHNGVVLVYINQNVVRDRIAEKTNTNGVLKMYRFRSTYWTHNKWVQRVYTKLTGIVPLKSGTSEQWAQYRREQQKHRLATWLCEDVVDFVQNIVMYPIDVVSTVKYWFRNRFIFKEYCLVSKLDKNTGHSLCTTILHANFDALVNFVEIEKASMQRFCSSKQEFINKFNIPKWKFLPIINWVVVIRSKQAGVEYLQWEATLDSPTEEYPVPLDGQATAARKILELYNWWTVSRPSRVDPYDQLEVFNNEMRTKYCIDPLTDVLNGELNLRMTEEENSAKEKCVQHCVEIEAQYEREDTAKLIELVSLRERLWT